MNEAIDHVAVRHDAAVMRFLGQHDGCATMTDIRQSMVVPSAFVMSIMSRLIAGKVVQLEGDATYKLMAKGKQMIETIFDSPSQLGGGDPDTEPASSGVQSPVNSESRPTGAESHRGERRCYRCRDWKPLSQYEFRDGLVQRGRICNACIDIAPPIHKARGPIGSSSVVRNKFDPDTHMAIEISPLVRSYLQQLVDIGLHGKSLEEAALSMLLRSLVDQLERGHLKRIILEPSI